jgi:spermidine/putrescine-binding protein
MKKLTVFLLIAVFGVFPFFNGCGSSAGENGEIYVYNWGEYIDPEVITLFEEENGIKVIYEEFETNESMYPVVQSEPEHMM